MSLTNISISQLNFTTNCTNLALGINIWINDFLYELPTPGNLTNDRTNDTYTDPRDNGPDDEYNDFWINGTDPDWISFWRYSLASALPSSDISLSDKEISDWSNSTEYFDFFDFLETTPLKLPDLTFPQDLSFAIAYDGGCKQDFDFSQNVTNLVEMQVACMLDYCCSSTTNDTVTHNPKAAFPYYKNWTVEDTCSFHTCTQANNGNPDLGGVGVLIAYLIEASMLALSIVAYSIRMLTDYMRPKRLQIGRRFLDSHDYAVLESSGIFLDTSVFFGLSICFAAVIFNYHGNPLLYEDKLGQAATLLTIDSPVAILLLSYPWIERRNLRIFTTVLAALMTFIIQFMFRRARSFNPGSNLCLNWDSFVEQVFKDRFTVYVITLVLPYSRHGPRCIPHLSPQVI